MKYKLDDIDKKHGFKVPEGYFEDLSMKIQSRVETEKSVSSWQKIPAWSLTLASVLLIFTLVFVFYDNGQSAEDLLAEVSQDELVAYLDQIELDEYDIASAFEGDVDALNLDEANVLDEINMEDQALDDVLLEYDLEDEYL